MKNFIDSLFSPIIQMVELMTSKLSGMGTVAAKGVNLDHYFGFFSILGPAFTGVISSLIVCLTFLFILYMIQKQSRVLLWFKALIKWW